MEGRGEVDGRFRGCPVILVVSSARAMNVTDLIRSWMDVDCAAYFALDDPGPFLCQTGHGVEAMRLVVNLLKSKKEEEHVVPPGGMKHMAGAVSHREISLRHSEESGEHLPAASDKDRG